MIILDQQQANSGTHNTTHIQDQLNMTHKATVLNQDQLFQDNLRIHKTTTIQAAPTLGVQIRVVRGINIAWGILDMLIRVSGLF